MLFCSSYVEGAMPCHANYCQDVTSVLLSSWWEEASKPLFPKSALTLSPTGINMKISIRRITISKRSRKRLWPSLPEDAVVWIQSGNKLQKSCCLDTLLGTMEELVSPPSAWSQILNLRYQILIGSESNCNLIQTESLVTPPDRFSPGSEI